MTDPLVPVAERGRTERGDLELLDAVLDDARLTDAERAAFAAMASRGGLLSPKQRAWLDRVADRLDLAEPSRNLVSRGLVPRGQEVQMPWERPGAEPWKHPLRPPGRR